MDERIQALERQNRRLRAMCLLSFTLSAAVLLIAANGKQNGNFDVVTANSIVVRGESGAISLDVGDDGPAFLMTTSAEEGSSYFVAVQPDQTFVRMSGANPSYGVNLSSRPDEALLEYGAGINDRRMWLHASKGSSTLSLYGSEKQNLYLSSFTGLFISHPEGNAFLNVYPRGPELSMNRQFGEKEEHKIAIGVGEDGPFTTLADRDGFQSQFGSVSLVTPRTGEQHQRSAASLVFFRGADVLWSAP